MKLKIPELNSTFFESSNVISFLHIVNDGTQCFAASWVSDDCSSGIIVTYKAIQNKTFINYENID